ncbi:chaperonin 10-like protein [Phaeosphaeriaceae sp. PMI808]|nr:chaperonin 10-like protein [Phaeosphaeriaceae sp. PMI808]
MRPQRIKQWLTDQNDLDKLRFDETDCLTPGEDEVLIEVCSVSLNFRDTKACMGLYNHHKLVEQPPAIIPCSDMCGVVVADSSFQLEEGDRVISAFASTHLTGQIEAQNIANGLGGPAPGVLVQYRIPDYVTNNEAACLPIAAMTAWMSLNCMRPKGEIVGSGEIIVCQDTGGVSISAAQIASAAGASAIATSSPGSKLAQATQLGAKTTISYRTTPDWDTAGLETTSSRGADTSKTMPMTGRIRTTNLLCLKRNVTPKGIINGPRDELERLLKFCKEKQVRPIVDKVFEFGEANMALKYLLGGRHFGKVVIKVKE